jgi:hypothetical protein
MPELRIIYYHRSGDEYVKKDTLFQSFAVDLYMNV